MTNAPHLLPKSREGFKYGDTDAGRLDGLRRACSTRSPRRRWACSPRSATPPSRTSPARSRTPSPPARTSSPPRRGRTASSTTRSSRSRSRSAGATRSMVDDRRGRPRRHDRRVARQAAPRVQQGRHDHRRHRLADLRRRRRGRGDEQGQGRGARPRVAGRDRRPRHGRRPGLDAADAAGQRHRPACEKEGISPPTSTWWSSTRRSPRSASPRPASSASPTRRSTSTAARSRSATRSACPAPGSCCTWRSSCKRRGGGVGAAALCGGGGQGDALIVKVPSA